MKRLKIALITASIGNAGKTGELKITSEAQAEFDEYGIDVYRFNNANLDLLLPHVKPTLTGEETVHRTRHDMSVYGWYEKVKYKQTNRPKKEDDYTRLVAKIPKMMFYKIVPHNYDYYVWLDSKFTIYEHWLDYLLWLLGNHSHADMIVSKHSVRSSVEEEVLDMLKGLRSGYPSLYTKYYAPDLAFQLYKYQQSPGFVDNSLNELGMIIYSSKIVGKSQFAEEWYAHNCYFTIQDQISFPFVSKKHNINLASIGQSVYEIPFLTHEYASACHQ